MGIANAESPDHVPWRSGSPHDVFVVAAGGATSFCPAAARGTSEAAHSASTKSNRRDMRPPYRPACPALRACPAYGVFLSENMNGMPMKSDDICSVSPVTVPV